jgi:hypothetical protein
MKKQENKVEVKAAKKNKKISIKDIVLKILAGKNVPGTDEIIALVLKECKANGITTRFDKTHLAWYKYQYKLGRWHDGVRQVIHEKDVPKKQAIKQKIKRVLKKTLTVNDKKEIKVLPELANKVIPPSTGA